MKNLIKLILFVLLVSITQNTYGYTLKCTMGFIECSRIKISVENVKSAGYNIENIYVTTDINELKTDVKISNNILGMFNIKTEKIFINPSQNISKIQYTVYHEIGHYLHKQRIGYVKFNNVRYFSEFEKYLMHGLVSNYALTNNIEFVAEVFADKISKKQISDIVIQVYKEFDGI